jgi:hypothetical protein
MNYRYIWSFDGILVEVLVVLVAAPLAIYPSAGCGYGARQHLCACDISGRED